MGWWKAGSGRTQTQRLRSSMRDDKAVPATQPGGPKQARDNRTARQLGYTHAWEEARPAGRDPWGAAVLQLDPKQQNSLPTLRRCKPVACLCVVPSRKSRKGVPASGCQTQTLSQYSEARAKARGRGRPRQHSSSASITGELSRRGSARR